ncbi:carbohydrate ABC transporter permease [Methylobacterium indicum]|uniref:ABC transporter permease n=1 Tax=Methylobacterium indicum TaxID=1775910 RepID=A0A8H8WNZ7_9HYPH|nr:carbohydrate ABC transporter permease [Methylobacterium indicum]BCM81675.1 ABC transporter permease [Methylobacterium indicum]
MYPTPIQLAPAPTQAAYRVLLYAVLVVWMAPLIAIMMTAVRSQSDLLAGNYWGLPTTFSLSANVREVFTTSPMGIFFINSLIVTCVTVASVLVLSTMAAVALAKYRFPGRTALFAMFIAGNFVPYQILMIPVRDLVLHLGAYDTVWGLILFHTAFQTGFATLFMRNFIVALPDELFESARLEGANEFQIITKIIVPLLRPALAGLSVLLFTFVWNDYFWALVLVQSDAAKPLTLGLAGLKGEWLTAWNLISAGAILAAIPPVALFFLMQKHFVAGLTVGAVKS